MASDDDVRNFFLQFQDDLSRPKERPSRKGLNPADLQDKTLDEKLVLQMEADLDRRLATLRAAKERLALQRIYEREMTEKRLKEEFARAQEEAARQRMIREHREEEAAKAQLQAEKATREFEENELRVVEAATLKQVDEIVIKQQRLEELRQQRELMDQEIFKYNSQIEAIQEIPLKKGKEVYHVFKKVMDGSSLLSEELEAGDFHISDKHRMAAYLFDQTKDTKEASQEFLTELLAKKEARFQTERQVKRETTLSLEQKKEKIKQMKAQIERKKEQLALLQQAPDKAIQLELGVVPPNAEIDLLKQPVPVATLEPTQVPPSKADRLTEEDAHKFGSKMEQMMSKLSKQKVHLSDLKVQVQYQQHHDQHQVAKIQQTIFPEGSALSKAELVQRQRALRLERERLLSKRKAEQERREIMHYILELSTELMEEMSREIFISLMEARKLSIAHGTDLSFQSMLQTIPDKASISDGMISAYMEMRRKRTQGGAVFRRFTHRNPTIFIDSNGFPISTQTGSTTDPSDNKTQQTDGSSSAATSQIGAGTRTTTEISAHTNRIEADEAMGIESLQLHVLDRLGVITHQANEYRRHELEYWSRIRMQSQPLSKFKASGGYTCVSMSPDGLYLAAGSRSGQFVVYDLKFQPPRVVRLVTEQDGHWNAPIQSLVWNMRSTSITMIFEGGNICVYNLRYRMGIVKNTNPTENLPIEFFYPLRELVLRPDDFYRPNQAGQGLDSKDRPKFLPTICTLHPSFNIAGEQPALIIGLRNGNIVKWNSWDAGYSNSTIIFGGILVPSEPPYPKLIDNLSNGRLTPLNHTTSIEARSMKTGIYPHYPYIKREFFHDHSQPILYIGFLKDHTTMISIDSAGYVSIWPYHVYHFTKFHYFVPASRFRLNTAIHIFQRQGQDEKVPLANGSLGVDISTPPIHQRFAYFKPQKATSIRTSMDRKRRNSLDSGADTELRITKTWIDANNVPHSITFDERGLRVRHIKHGFVCEQIVGRIKQVEQASNGDLLVMIVFPRGFGLTWSMLTSLAASSSSIARSNTGRKKKIKTLNGPFVWIARIKPCPETSKFSAIDMALDLDMFGGVGSAAQSLGKEAKTHQDPNHYTRQSIDDEQQTQAASTAHESSSQNSPESSFFTVDPGQGIPTDKQITSCRLEVVSPSIICPLSSPRDLIHFAVSPMMDLPPSDFIYVINCTPNQPIDLRCFSGTTGQKMFSNRVPVNGPKRFAMPHPIRIQINKLHTHLVICIEGSDQLYSVAIADENADHHRVKWNKIAARSLALKRIQLEQLKAIDDEILSSTRILSGTNGGSSGIMKTQPAQTIVDQVDDQFFCRPWTECPTEHKLRDPVRVMARGKFHLSSFATDDKSGVTSVSVKDLARPIEVYVRTLILNLASRVSRGHRRRAKTPPIRFREFMKDQTFESKAYDRFARASQMDKAVTVANFFMQGSSNLNVDEFGYSGTAAEHKAATMIQARYRGFQLRRQMTQTK